MSRGEPVIFWNMARTAADPMVFPQDPLLGLLRFWAFGTGVATKLIVQRVLAAKDEKNARLGPLFCAFLKIFPVFLFVLPGGDL